MWFKVSDDFHSHPKVMAAGFTAVGLWTVAGSWSSEHGTGGFVSDAWVQRQSEDAPQLARRLVAAGLWSRSKGGYQFHEWTERNPSEQASKALQADRKRAAAIGNHKRWHTDRGIRDISCEFCREAS